MAEITFMSEWGGVAIHHDKEETRDIDYEDGIVYLLDQLKQSHKETMARKRAALDKTTKSFGDDDAIRLIKEMEVEQEALAALREAEELILERW